MRAYAGGKPVHYCEDCGRCFFASALRIHTCHVVGDPVWLGQQEAPPDLSITYIRWCRQNALTLGGVPGQMPGVIPDETVSEPIPGSHMDRDWGSNECECDGNGCNDNCDEWDDNYDEWDDNYDEWDENSDGGDRIDNGQDGNKQDGYGWDSDDGHDGREVMPKDNSCDDISSHNIEANGRRHQGPPGQSSLAAHRKRMRDKLKYAGITFLTFEETPCEGLAWKHGFFPCPFRSIITAETAYFGRFSRCQGHMRVHLLPWCYKCAYLRRAIDQWIRESKYTVDGVHLCRRGGCREPTAAVWHCRRHADEVAARNIRGDLKLGSLRVSSAEAIASLVKQSPRRTLICPLWKVVRQSLQQPRMPGAEHTIFFIDTESFYDYQQKCFLISEIAVRSSSNELLLDTLIDHGLTYGELRRRVRSDLFGKLLRMYGFHGADSRTHGMTPTQATQALVRIGMNPSAIVIEWSLHGFDLNALRQTFDPVIFPSCALLGHRLWRDIGLKGSVALLPLFASMFPDSDLRGTHHRASIDSEKLFLVVKKAMQCFC
ncbi:hypothetical protein F4861DRAFT_536443 [Xylaria intraflava]|nr:hypothetical protein F4861DRAFT_536443 [Xylaria intraflava]